MAKKTTKTTADCKKDNQQAAGLRKEVADPARIQILMLLDEEERNVGAMCEALGVQSQPVVSHRLALLRFGRLIEPRRDRKHSF